MLREAVADNNRRFVAAAGRGDFRAMADVYADDAELLPPNAEPLRGRSGIERFWQGGIEMGIRGIELETLALEAGDGFVCEVGRCTIRIEPGAGEPLTDVGKYVIVHRRQADDSWRRSVEIFNWDAPLV